MDFANVRSWEVEGGVRDIYGIAMGMGLMGGREGREGRGRGVCWILI